MIIEPLSIGRDVFEKRIASRYVLELLWKAHLQFEVSDMKYLYNLFQASTTVTASTGWIFELRAHQLLAREKPIRSYRITQDKPGTVKFIYGRYSGGRPKVLQSPGSGQVPFAKGEILRKTCYYRPSPTDFPDINSFILTHPRRSSPILVVFHVIWSAGEYHVSEDALKSINTLPLPKNTRQYHVVVTPEGVQPVITVPKGHFEVGRGGGKKLSKKTFRVFNYPLSVDELFRGRSLGPV